MKAFRKVLAQQYAKAVEELEKCDKQRKKALRRIYSLEQIIIQTSDLLEKDKISEAKSILRHTMKRINQCKSS